MQKSLFFFLQPAQQKGSDPCLGCECSVDVIDVFLSVGCEEKHKAIHYYLIILPVGIFS